MLGALDRQSDIWFNTSVVNKDYTRDRGFTMSNVKDFWTGKTDAELAATMATQERDFYRSYNSFGDGRNHREVMSGDFSRTADPRTAGTILDTLCEETAHVDNSAVKDSIATIRAALAKVNVKAAEAFDAIGMVAWDDERSQPNLVQFAKALGITRNPARKRWQALNTLLRSEAFATLAA